MVFYSSPSQYTLEIWRMDTKNDGALENVSALHILLMEEILHQLKLVGYPIVYNVLYIPSGWH